METEDVSFAVVRFESGVQVSVVNSVVSPRETSYLRFDFTDATVEVEHLYGYDNSNWRWTPAPHVTDAAVSAAWLPEENVPSSHTAQLRELLDSLERRERPRASGADGRRTLEFVTGMYRSAITGRPVLRAELTTDDPFYSSMAGPDADAARRVFTGREVSHV